MPFWWTMTKAIFGWSIALCIKFLSVVSDEVLFSMTVMLSQSCKHTNWMQFDLEIDVQVFKLFRYCDLDLLPLPWLACLFAKNINRRQCDGSMSYAAKLMTEQSCSLLRDSCVQCERLLYSGQYCLMSLRLTIFAWGWLDCCAHCSPMTHAFDYLIKAFYCCVTGLSGLLCHPMTDSGRVHTALVVVVLIQQDCCSAC